MKVLLTIGYVSILLPDESGVQQVLKVLGRGRAANAFSMHRGVLELEPGILAVSVQTVPPNVKITEKRVEELPE